MEEEKPKVKNDDDDGPTRTYSVHCYACGIQYTSSDPSGGSCGNCSNSIGEVTSEW